DPDDCEPRATNDLGAAFPLTISRVGPRGSAVLPVIHHDGLIGESTNIMIDTGCNIDGLIEQGTIRGAAAILPERVWDGAVYTNLVLAVVERANVLGLGFLSRHLVTLDFPNQTLYLKQTSVGPLASDRDALLEISSSEIRPAAELLEDLRKSGRLPGWSD